MVSLTCAERGASYSGGRASRPPSPRRGAHLAGAASVLPALRRDGGRDALYPFRCLDSVFVRFEGRLAGSASGRPCDGDRPARMRAPASTSSAIGLPEESQRHERRYRDGKRFADMPVGHGIGMGRVAVAAFAGLDWGFREHVACVVDGSGSVVAERSFGHGGAGLGSLAEWLRSHDAPAVAMETPRGAVAAFLLSREIEVRSINPRQSDRFRDRHSPSGSKDDRRDARVLANALRTDPQALRRVSAQRPEEVALGSLQRRLDWLGEDRGRLESRLRAELWEFYPEFETMAAGLKVGLATEWVLSLLERLPRPGTVRGVRDATLRKALKRARKVDAAGVRAALDVPTAATEARIEAGADAAAWLRRRLLETMREIAALERQRERLLDELKEAPGEAVREPGPAGSEGAPGEAAAADPARGAEDEPRRGRRPRRAPPPNRRRPTFRTTLRRMAARHRSRPRRRHPRHPPRQRRRRHPPAQPPGAAMPVRNRARHPTVRKVPARRPPRSRRSRPAKRHVPLRTRRQGQRPRPASRLRPAPPARPRRRPRPAKGRRLHRPLHLRHPPKPTALGPLHPTAQRRLTQRPPEPPERGDRNHAKVQPTRLANGKRVLPPERRSKSNTIARPQHPSTDPPQQVGSK